jgi:predicted nucleic acid-binding protein
MAPNNSIEQTPTSESPGEILYYCFFNIWNSSASIPALLMLGCSTSLRLTNIYTIVQLSKIHFLEVNMDVVIDTSALIAVIVGEPERNKIVELTTENTLIGPGSIPWEIGNAFSAMFKRNKLSLNEAQKGLVIFESIPLRYIKPDFVNSMTISKQTNMYAYDAYFLDCAIRQKAPLLTLDRRLKTAAQSLKVTTMEV